MKRTLITTLLTTLALAACGEGAPTAPTAKLDRLDLASPVVVVGGSEDVRLAAEAAITSMGGRIGETSLPHVEVTIAGDPNCLRCIGGPACGNSGTLWVCPKLSDMSRNQADRRVWSATAQALWGVDVLFLPCGGVLSGSCGTPDTPPAWTPADVEVICQKAHGGRCH